MKKSIESYVQSAADKAQALQSCRNKVEDDVVKQLLGYQQPSRRYPPLKPANLPNPTGDDRVTLIQAVTGALITDRTSLIEILLMQELGMRPTITGFNKPLYVIVDQLAEGESKFDRLGMSLRGILEFIYEWPGRLHQMTWERFEGLSKAQIPMLRHGQYVHLPGPPTIHLTGPMMPPTNPPGREASHLAYQEFVGDGIIIAARLEVTCPTLRPYCVRLSTVLTVPELPMTLLH